MCVCISVCVYTCVSVYTCVYMSVYGHMYLHAYMHVYACMCARVRVYMYVYGMFKCVHLYVCGIYVFMHVRVCAYRYQRSASGVVPRSSPVCFGNKVSAACGSLIDWLASETQESSCLHSVQEFQTCTHMTTFHVCAGD